MSKQKSNNFTVAVVAIAAVVAIGVIALATNPGFTGKAASNNACDQLYDIYNEKFMCCADYFAACGGIENAYSKAGCGTLSCGCDPNTQTCCTNALWRTNYLGSTDARVNDLCNEITDMNVCINSFYTETGINEIVGCSVGDYFNDGVVCQSNAWTAFPTTCSTTKDLPIMDYYSDYFTTKAEACGLLTSEEVCLGSKVVVGYYPADCSWTGTECI